MPKATAVAAAAVAVADDSRGAFSSVAFVTTTSCYLSQDPGKGQGHSVSPHIFGPGSQEHIRKV
jgi:hypothetical protein